MDYQQNQDNFQQPGYQNLQNQNSSSGLKPIYYVLIGCGSLIALCFIGFEFCLFAQRLSSKVLVP